MLQFTRHALSNSLGWDCHTLHFLTQYGSSEVQSKASILPILSRYNILNTRLQKKKDFFSLTLPVMGDDSCWIPGGEGLPCKKDGNVRRVKKAIVVHVGVFSLKGSTVGAFPVCFGYWAEYIYKPHPQYGILVFLRSSLPTSTPLFKWELDDR